MFLKILTISFIICLFVHCGSNFSSISSSLFCFCALYIILFGIIQFVDKKSTLAPLL